MHYIRTRPVEFFTHPREQLHPALLAQQDPYTAREIEEVGDANVLSAREFSRSTFVDCGSLTASSIVLCEEEDLGYPSISKRSDFVSHTLQ